MGTAHSSAMPAESTRKWGIATQQAGQQAFTAAVGAGGAGKGNAARQAMALLTQGAGAFAREESGHVPTSIGGAWRRQEKLAPRPVRVGNQFLNHRSAKAGVEVPRLGAPGRRAKRHRGRQAGHGRRKTPLAGLPAAGHAGWQRAGHRREHRHQQQGRGGHSAGPCARGPGQGHPQLVGQHRQEKWASAEVGGGLMRGIAQGIAKGMPEVQGAARRCRRMTTVAAKAILPLIEAAGRTIGLTQAKGVVMGLLQGQPSIVVQAQQALKAATGAPCARRVF